MSEQREALAEFAFDLAFDLTEKYGLPFTNNEPRVQDGQQLHHIGEFVGDLTRLLAEAEQRGADRVAAAVEAAIREHGQQHIGGHVWTRDDYLRAALTTGAADRVRAEEGDRE